MDKSPWVWIILGVIVIIGSLVLYTITFNQNSWSQNPENWSQFADYFNAFVGLANLIVLAGLTITLDKINQQRDDERQLHERLAERPILVFEKINDNWQVTNIGRGPAINIRGYDSLFTSNLNKRYLRSDESMPTGFIVLDTDKGGLIYYNIFQQRFESIFTQGETRLVYYKTIQDENGKEVYRPIKEERL